MDSDGQLSETDYEPLSFLAHELGERVKELNCLFGISDIVERAQGSLETILMEAVELLCISWDHADVSCARITLEGREFLSRNFAPGVARQTADLKVHEKTVGSVEVVYTEERPPRFEGPFSRDERRLLDAVAERLGHTIERLKTTEILKQQEAEFRQRMTHVTRVSTMGEMATSIAHEVNQPLTAIATYAQACLRLVDQGLLTAPETREVLQKVSDEALRAGEIIRRLRDLVQRKPTKLVECHLPQLVREVTPLASADARLHDVNFTVQLPRTVPLILADGTQVQQVMLNLIRNGIDAMGETPRDARTLELRVVEGARGVEVSVADRGCGLPDVTEEELFEPFFTTKPTGLGLGLSISRSIIEAHGGRLWYRRNPDGGTTFLFTLPKAGAGQDD